MTHIKNPALTIDAYLTENYPGKFHPDPNGNDGAFLKRLPQQEEKKDEQFLAKILMQRL